MYDTESICEIVGELIQLLIMNKALLSELNVQITGDTDFWINHDYQYLVSYLSSYVSVHKDLLNENRKPRGKVLILLSYNEPYILSVIPILNALISGNEVHVRPSTSAQVFFANIWIKSGITEKYILPITQLDHSIDSVYENLHYYDCVYFFGGYEHAKKLAAACGELYIPFFPEIEGADTKIILPTQTLDWDISSDVVQTLTESFNHAGQSCQRIHGVFVPNSIKDGYVKAIIEMSEDSTLIHQHIRSNHNFQTKHLTVLDDDIRDSNPKIIYKFKDAPQRIVIDPHIDSNFVMNAYFLPTLWIIGYEDTETVLTHLNQRKFRLGLNIHGNNDKLIKRFVDKTKFSRYTINSSHIEIRSGEGWGGIHPTGFCGYQSWVEHFSYKIHVQH